MKKLKNKKGITLVALVITIVVLLILAVITINEITGNGIISKAKEARQNYTNASQNEEEFLAGQVADLDSALDPNPIEGTLIAASDNKAINVNNQLVYIIDDEDNNTAKVCGYRGDINYTNPMELMMNAPTTSGEIEIASKVKIENVIYNVTQIEDYAFVVQGFDCSTASITYMSCENLNSIKLPNSITSIGSFAFAYCTSLAEITIPNSVTSIGSDVFYNCTSLNSMTIPSGVTSIGIDAFYNTPWLTTQQSLNNGIVIAGSVLYDATTTTLTDVTIPSNVTNIACNAFDGCTSLISLTIPSNVVKINDGILAYGAFMGCTNLSSVTIENGLTHIGDYAFAYCTSLAEITIPNSVTSMGYSTFWADSNLVTINIDNTTNSISEANWSANNATVNWLR